MSTPTPEDSAPSPDLVDSGLTAEITLKITDAAGNASTAVIEAKAPDAGDETVNVRALLQVAIDTVVHDGDANITTG